MKIMTLWDKILIGTLIIVSVFSILYMLNSTIDPLNTNVIIQVDGKQIAKIPLTSDKQLRTYDFRFGENTGTLEMLEGRVRMTPMDQEVCPEGICSDTGWIQNNYQAIVCLPNKIVVTIESNKEKDIDLVVMARF